MDYYLCIYFEIELDKAINKLITLIKNKKIIINHYSVTFNSYEGEDPWENHINREFDIEQLFQDLKSNKYEQISLEIDFKDPEFIESREVYLKFPLNICLGIDYECNLVSLYKDEKVDLIRLNKILKEVDFVVSILNPKSITDNDDFESFEDFKNYKYLNRIHYYSRLFSEYQYKLGEKNIINFISFEMQDLNLDLFLKYILKKFPQFKSNFYLKEDSKRFKNYKIFLENLDRVSLTPKSILDIDTSNLDLKEVLNKLDESEFSLILGGLYLAKSKEDYSGDYFFHLHFEENFENLNFFVDFSKDNKFQLVFEDINYNDLEKINRIIKTFVKDLNPKSTKLFNESDFLDKPLENKLFYFDKDNKLIEEKLIK